MDRLERRREAALERYGLGDVLGDIRRELDEIVAQERAGVERRLADASADGDGRRGPARDAARRRGQAARPARRLPTDIGERLRGLQDYDFLEPEARGRFDDLVGKLRAQMLDQYVAGMSDAIRSMSPEDLAANREMVRDLNDLIRQRIGGADPDVREFLAKHGAFFPGATDLRRHHRPAGRPDGGDAVAPALDVPGATGGAQNR